MKELIGSLLDSVLVRAPIFQKSMVLMGESTRALQLLFKHNMQLQELCSQALLLSEMQVSESDDIKVALNRSGEFQEQMADTINKLVARRDAMSTLPRLFETPQPAKHKTVN